MEEETKTLISRIENGLKGTMYKLSAFSFWDSQNKRNCIRLIIHWERVEDSAGNIISKEEWLQFDEFDFKVLRVSDPDTTIITWLIRSFFT